MSQAGKEPEQQYQRYQPRRPVLACIGPRFLRVRVNKIYHVPRVATIKNLQGLAHLAHVGLHALERVVVARRMAEKAGASVHCAHDIAKRRIPASTLLALLTTRVVATVGAQPPANPGAEAMSRADQDGDAHVPERVDHVGPLVHRDSDVQIFYKHVSLSLSDSLSKVQDVCLFFSYRNNTGTNYPLSVF